MTEDTHWNADNMVYGDTIKYHSNEIINTKNLFINKINNLYENFIASEFYTDVNDDLINCNYKIEECNIMDSNINGFINNCVQKNYIGEIVNHRFSYIYSKDYKIVYPNSESIMQSINLYNYCIGNPINYKDSLGSNAMLGATVGGSIAGPIGAAIGATAGAAAMVAGAVYYKEHTSGARKSTLNKHQKGQSRKKRDNGGEKGDARRIARKDKRK